MTTALTTAELAPVRAALLEEKARMLAQVSTLAGADQELAAARVSQEERVKSAGDADMFSVERELVSQMSDAMRAAVADIDEAVARIDAGQYGTCTGCGQPIPVERLLARPKASTCVRCASSPRGR